MLRYGQFVVAAFFICTFIGCPPPQSPDHTVTITGFSINNQNNQVRVDANFTGPPNSTAQAGAAKNGTLTKHVATKAIDFDAQGKASASFTLLNAGPGDEVAVGVTDDNFATLSTDSKIAQ